MQPALPSRGRYPALAGGILLSLLVTSNVSAQADLEEVVACEPEQGLAAPSCVGDEDRDRVVTISELVKAVNNSLHGCPEPTATPTRSPGPTAPPLPAELQILRTIGDELAPSPGQFGCSSIESMTFPGHFSMTCELPVGFAAADITRHGDDQIAAAAFEEARDGEPLITFEGYDAFEEELPSLTEHPGMRLTWRADRWVFKTAQVAVVTDATLYLELANRILEEAEAVGLLDDN